MKKRFFILLLVIFLVISFSLTYLFDEGYLYVSKGPRFESISKKESKFMRRFESDYVSNKSTIKLCDSIFSIGGVWSEKYRSSLKFYNLFIETDVNFFEKGINCDIYCKNRTRLKEMGYSSFKYRKTLISMLGILSDSYIVIFYKKGKEECRDSIVLTKQTPRWR